MELARENPPSPAPATDHPAAPASAPAAFGKLGRLLLMVVMTLLILELVLGLLTNALVSKLPSSPEGFFTGAGSNDYAVALGHVVLGYLLGVLGLVIIVSVYRTANSRALVGSVLGLAFVGISGVAGMEFVTSGGAGAWSGVMALTFVAAFACYLAVERATRPPKKKAEP